MPILNPTVAELRLTVDPGILGFDDTSELQEQALPWAGQERAGIAVHFGLAMAQADYTVCRCPGCRSSRALR